MQTASGLPEVLWSESHVKFVKSVFLPIHVVGRLWGVFELAYRQDLADCRRLAA